MAVIKTITVDGQEVKFKASAAIPRIYRARFGRDLFKDLDALVSDINENDANSSTLPVESLEVFENISFLMARYADPSVPDDPVQWLDRFETFSIYNILPQILELWGLNTATDSESKKKADPAADR